MKKVIVIVLLILCVGTLVYFFMQNYKKEEAINLAKMYYKYWLEDNKEDLKEIVTSNIKIESNEEENDVINIINNQFVEKDNYFEFIDIVKIDNSYIVKAKIKIPNYPYIYLDNLGISNTEEESGGISAKFDVDSEQIKKYVKDKLEDNTLQCVESEVNIIIISDNGKLKVNNIEAVNQKSNLNNSEQVNEDKEK